MRGLGRHHRVHLIALGLGRAGVRIGKRHIGPGRPAAVRAVLVGDLIQPPLRDFHLTH